MFKIILLIGVLSVGTAYAKTEITDIELIELLGEFTQEEVDLLETTMPKKQPQDNTSDQQIEPTGVSDENSND